MAEELGVPMRLSALTREDMEEAVARGQGESDSRSFLKLQLERAGVGIEVAQERIEGREGRGQLTFHQTRSGKQNRTSHGNYPQWISILQLGPAANFTGHARRDPLFKAPAPSRMVGGQ